MSSTMSKGLMSCLEPRLEEPTIFHSLSFNKSKDHEQENIIIRETNSKLDNLGQRSFIQTICNTSQDTKQGTKTEQVYVHPLVKKSSMSPSPKSLEMCTEGLGSETGCNIDVLLQELNKNHGLHISRSSKIVKKVDHSVTFPPPLNSIIGSNGVQVRPYREDGRLVLKAVSIPFIIRHFQAVRANGRLRISFLKEASNEVDNNDIDDDDLNINEKVGCEVEKQVGRENFGWLYHRKSCVLELRVYEY